MQGKKMRVKKDDMVMVIAGKDNAKTGKILRVLAKKDSVVVEGLNLIKKHIRAKGNQPGGIEEKEAPIHISNVMLYCPKCTKPVRVKKTLLENGEKVRLCVKCGVAFDK
ncbi:MAG: 50S ribosomal protein L24 [Geobacteraceae bacterium]|nr:50S ribosomal protein L24 [Geobacteraceae bacterium]